MSFQRALRLKWFAFALQHVLQNRSLHMLFSTARRDTTVCDTCKPAQRENEYIDSKPMQISTFGFTLLGLAIFERSSFSSARPENNNNVGELGGFGFSIAEGNAGPA